MLHDLSDIISSNEIWKCGQFQSSALSYHALHMMGIHALYAIGMFRCERSKSSTMSTATKGVSVPRAEFKCVWNAVVHTVTSGIENKMNRL